MKKRYCFLALLLLSLVHLQAQVEPAAGQWKTWFIPSVKSHRLLPPNSNTGEGQLVLAQQQQITASSRLDMQHFNAGAPGYRWQEMMHDTWMSDTNNTGALANMLLAVATYDATIVAWDTKYTYNRQRPFQANSKIKLLVPNPASPSYPCEYSVAAGVAVTIFSHFFPALADSVQVMARKAMHARIVAGVDYPTDTEAGFELGKKIAALEIEATKNYSPSKNSTVPRPNNPALWQGDPSFSQAGLGKTIVLEKSSQFRPGPPPDFAKDMAELKSFKPNFRSTANAFFFASQSFWEDQLEKKIFEYNLHLNPPRAARIYAITNIGMYDGFTACWDAKFTYWGTRPDQYDTTFKPVLFFTPPFPGYPSGHAMLGQVMAELYAYFFPAEKDYFYKKAKDAAESRFQGGIHFRTDNEVGLEMGKKVGGAIIVHVKKDGAGEW